MDTDIKDSPLRNVVLELLSMGFTKTDIILEVHSALAIDGQDQEIQHLLTVLHSMVTGKHKEQLGTAMALNYYNNLTADKYARELYKAAATHLMIQYVDTDSVIKVTNYNIQMQNNAALDRMCQKAINMFTLRNP
jgi:hypothetical protein